MKKILKPTVLLAVTILLFLGCKKDKDVLLESYYDVMYFDNVNEFDTYLHEINKTSFKSIDEFKAANGISQHPLQRVIAETELVDTNDNQDSETLPDLEIVRLLNGNGVIAIENFFFKLDFDKMRVYALPRDKNSSYLALLDSDTTDPNIMTFSFDEEVFSDPRISLTRSCNSTIAPNNFASNQTYKDLPGLVDQYRYKAKLRYTKYGIASLLKAKIVLHRKSNGEFYSDFITNIKLDVNGSLKDRCVTQETVSASTSFDDMKGLRKFYVYGGVDFLENYDITVRYSDTKNGYTNVVSTQVRF